MALGKSSFINTVLCHFGKQNPKAPVSHEKTSSTTVVRRYIAYQDKEITINLVDAWGIQQDKWNDKYFEEYLDGILDGVDKDRIEIDRPDTKNPMCSLDLVLFFLPSFTCKPIPQNESLNHSYFPYIDVCKRKRVPYAFLVSFVGMENEERKKNVSWRL